MSSRLLFIFILTLASSTNVWAVDALDAAGTPSCVITKCSEHTTQEMSIKIAACEVVVASQQCQSLGPNVELRDCKSEAFCPFELDQDYVAGCLVGAGRSIAQMYGAILTAPANLLYSGLKRTEYEAKYFNSSLYQACKQAELKVAQNPKALDLDCGQNFWRAACPRTLVRNCKDGLLEAFPDLKASYGTTYEKVPYEQILTDVRKRLNELSDARPSLTKYLRDHPTNPLAALRADLGQALSRQGYKFACMSSYDVANFSCDLVIKAFTVVVGGYSAVSKLAKTAGATERGVARAALAESEAPRTPAVEEVLQTKASAPAKLERSLDDIAGDYGDDFKAINPDWETMEIIRALEKKGFSRARIKKLINEAGTSCSSRI